ncbi:hypothetical protein MCEMAEM4_02950 [Burkholderiaceae bacterium]
MALVAVTCTTLPTETFTVPLASKIVPACVDALLTTKAKLALVTPALKSPAVIHALAPDPSTLISPETSRSNEKSPLMEKVSANVACKPTTLTTGVVTAVMPGMTCEKPPKSRVLVTCVEPVLLTCTVAEVALAEAKPPPLSEKLPVASSQ